MEQNPLPAGESRIFVLDIGTRSVVGIAGHQEGELFVVEAHAMEPHSRRAMIDGQIEDIEQVARVAGSVKRQMEQQLGTTFTQVGVAAAGRALKTTRASASLELPAGIPITPQNAYALENAAINEARLQLDLASEEAKYYCVGHSVVRYLLDGYPFTTMVGHRAALAEVEIIATFLPAEVVESLRRCMDLLGLEIDTLTLEPIAAMRAVIPQDLRLLNLALVDIGAGTSDIALSAEGSVSGYTMATVAGDEVSESIIKKYLVDFPTAERLKMGMDTEESQSYVDILGFEQQVDTAELLTTIDSAVDTLAEVIAERVKDCNAGPPAAVFMVGGGSKTPGLCQKLAGKLGLADNRVALAGTNFSGKLLSENSGLDGPEFATPVGIALITAENASVEGASVTINGRRVRLFTPASTSVMDALLLGGYTYSDLMGRNGRPLNFTLNGVRTLVRGGPYTAAEISVNGKPASLATPVENRDSIDLVVAQSGEDAFAEIADYAQGERPIRVDLNGKGLLAGLIARINGTVATPDTPIQDQDAVELYVVHTVGELCDAAGVPTEGATITVNGEAAEAGTTLRDADQVQVLPKGAEAPVEPKAVPQRPAIPVEEPKPAPLPPPPQAASLSVEPEPAAEAPALEPAPVAEMPALEPEPKLTPAEPTPELVTGAPAPVPEPKLAPAEPTHAAVAEAPAPSPKPEHTPEPTPVSAPIPEPVSEPKPIQEPKAVPAPEPAPVAAAEPPTPVPEPAPVPEAEAPAPEPAPEPAAETPAPAPEPAAPALTIPQANSKPAAEPQLIWEPASRPAPVAPAPAPQPEPEPVPKPEPEPAPTPGPGRSLRIELNGKTVVLPPKPSGEPHRLFDMLALVDIDPANPKGMVKVTVNGRDAPYLEELVSGDVVSIGWEENPLH